jgi:hypothetical protein
MQLSYSGRSNVRKKCNYITIIHRKLMYETCVLYLYLYFSSFEAVCSPVANVILVGFG